MPTKRNDGGHFHRVWRGYFQKLPSKHGLSLSPRTSFMFQKNAALQCHCSVAPSRAKSKKNKQCIGRESNPGLAELSL